MGRTDEINRQLVQLKIHKTIKLELSIIAIVLARNAQILSLIPFLESKEFYHNPRNLKCTTALNGSFPDGSIINFIGTPSMDSPGSKGE